MAQPRSLQSAAALAALEATQGIWRVVPITSPAAGSDFTITVPGFATWRLGTLRFLFTSSAVVANRFIRLLLDDGTTEFARLTVNNTVTATSTRIFTFADGLNGEPSDFANSGLAERGWPNVPLPPGYRIRSSTTNIDAADTFTQIAIYVHEFSTAQPVMEGIRELNELYGTLPWPAPTGGS